MPQKETPEPQISLQPPTRERLFRLETEEAMLKDFLRQTPGTPLPQEPPAPPSAYAGRHWKPQTEVVEPSYTCYGRLYFEQINAERYGWSLGLVQPLVSAGHFYLDVITLPYHLGTEPLRCYECDAGYGLPGDPVPLLIYPPECSLSGALTEAATIAALLAIFPP